MVFWKETSCVLLCDHGEIGRGIHFVFYCPLYDYLRPVGYYLKRWLVPAHPEVFWLQDELRLELFLKREFLMLPNLSAKRGEEQVWCLCSVCF